MNLLLNRLYCFILWILLSHTLSCFCHICRQTLPSSTRPSSSDPNSSNKNFTRDSHSRVPHIQTNQQLPFQPSQVSKNSPALICVHEKFLIHVLSFKDGIFKNLTVMKFPYVLESILIPFQYRLFSFLDYKSKSKMILTYVLNIRFSSIKKLNTSYISDKRMR